MAAICHTPSACGSLFILYFIFGNTGNGIQGPMLARQVINSLLNHYSSLIMVVELALFCNLENLGFSELLLFASDYPAHRWEPGVQVCLPESLSATPCSLQSLSQLA
jgi:hypothetical protein